mgnify:CR=1 FL=1
MNYEADKMRGRLSLLYKAIEELGQTKLIKDHHDQELTKYDEIRRTLESEKKDLEQKLEKATEEDKKKENILLDFE